MTYSMTCSCGDIMKMDGETREEAVMEMKKKMDGNAIAMHMKEKHPGDPVPMMSDVHAMIDKDMKPMM